MEDSSVLFCCLVRWAAVSTFLTTSITFFVVVIYFLWFIHENKKLTLLHLRNTTFHSSMTKGKSVRTFKLGPFQFPDAYLRGYAPRTFSKCFTFACFCKKSKGLLNPLITVHYFFFVCLYVCNRGDTYYSFTASSRQGSLAKPLSLRSLLRSLIVKLINRQYFPRKTGL